MGRWHQISEAKLSMPPARRLESGVMRHSFQASVKLAAWDAPGEKGGRPQAA
jgi:hypothetical protein